MKKVQNKLIATLIIVTILLSNCYALFTNIVYASSSFEVIFEGAHAGNGEPGYENNDVIYYEFEDSYIDQETQELVQNTRQIRARVQEDNGIDNWYCAEVFSTSGDDQIATLVVEDAEDVNEKYKINFEGDITRDYNVFVNDEKLTAADLIIFQPILNDDYTVTVIDKEITDGMTIRLEKREVKYVIFNSNPVYIDGTTLAYTDGENDVYVQVGTKIDDGEGGYTFTPNLIDEIEDTYIDEHGEEQQHTHIEAELETATLDDYYFCVTNPNEVGIEAWINGNQIPDEWAEIDEFDSTKAWVSLAEIAGEVVNVDLIIRNDNPGPQPTQSDIELLFDDNAIVSEQDNKIIYTVNGLDIEVTVTGKQIADRKLEIEAEEVNNVIFTLDENFDKSTMEVMVRSTVDEWGMAINDEEINGDNEFTLGNLGHFPEGALKLFIQNKPQNYSPVEAPEFKAGYITVNMEVMPRGYGQLNYFFVNAQNKYLDAEGNVLTEQKEPAGAITSNDDVKEAIIPQGTVKVLIGLESGRNSDFYNIYRYYNENDFDQLEKDDIVHGNTIEFEYNENDSIAIAFGIEYRDEGFYPEQKGTYLIADFRGNTDALVKYIDNEQNEQTLTSNNHLQEDVISIPRVLTMQITEKQLDNLRIDVYDENLQLINGEDGDIALLLADEEDETKNYEAWLRDIINGEEATLDLSDLNEDYTFVVDIRIMDPHEDDYAHVLTWTNMRGSGWPDDALIDGGFARVVKAYDENDNLIYDINEEYDESCYVVDDRGNITDKYFYGNQMPYEWERGPMYPFAIVQNDDGGEVEAIEGIKLIVELSPVYGKQLVGVSLGESIGEAEDSNARYYELTMPPRHTHFNAQFTEVNNESLVGEGTPISQMEYTLDNEALDSGTAVLSIDKIDNLSNEQKQAFATEAGSKYTVSNYLDVDLTQVWFKGTEATFNASTGYSAEEVWTNEIYDLGNKKATITITLDEGINPDDVIILHELHDDQGNVTGYEKVTITNKEKNANGVWTITFTTSKFSNFAIATRIITNYTVSFNTNGGSTVPNQTVESGEKAVKPTNPTKEGYTFEGWYSDSKCINRFDFTKAITSNTTIYARWNQIYNNEFTDVKTTNWYYNAVKYCYENNIMSGLNGNTFGPTNKLTRGMMVSILYKMEGSPKVTVASNFTDVQDSSKYYYKPALWAAEKKIVSGYNDGRFGPSDNITREQLAVILYKYAKYKGKDVSKTNDLSAFSDSNKVASYAVSQVKWAVASGVITGSNGKLNPKGNATRAEVAAMMEKYCKKVGR